MHQLLWLISIAGLRFGFGHRFLYCADTMGKGIRIWFWVSGNMFCTTLCIRRVWNLSLSPKLNPSTALEISHYSNQVRLVDPMWITTITMATITNLHPSPHPSRPVALPWSGFLPPAVLSEIHCPTYKTRENQSLFLSLKSVSEHYAYSSSVGSSPPPTCRSLAPSRCSLLGCLYSSGSCASFPSPLRSSLCAPHRRRCR